jgi:polyhydroxyalkanoate synthesis regulator phasin
VAAPKADWHKSVLDSLVAKGTITQAQADEILAALQSARPAYGFGRRGFGHGFGNLDAAAQALGVTADELRSALQGGKNLADVAKEKGVDVSKVVDTLVAELKAHLAEEVKSGGHTQAEADQILAEAKTRIQDFVNGKAPAGGPGFGGPGFGGPGGGRGHGHGGPGGPGGFRGSAQGRAPANGSSGSTATTS